MTLPGKPMSAVLLLSALAAGPAMACRAPPEEQMISPEALVARGGDVTLATVVGATGAPFGEPAFDFLVVRRLSGVGLNWFTLPGISGRRDSGNTFDGHADPVFWQRGGGRLANDTDCLIHPTFVVGATYLVFAGQPLTRRSDERIDMADGGAGDRWLAFVAARLARWP